MSIDNSAASIPAEVSDFLAHHNILTLATASPSGLPHAATLLYVNDGVVLYCWTRPETTTAQYIAQNPMISFTIDEYASDWSKMQGIQGSGEAEVVLNPKDVEEITTRLQEKFSTGTGVRTGNLSFFRIKPTSVQFIDTKGEESKVGQSLGTEWHRSMVYNIFRGLPEQQVDSVVSKLSTFRVNPGEVIVRQGAPADKFFIIAEGGVEVLREEDGTVHKVATLDSGQFFGEMAILRDMPRTATVRATQATTLLAMDRDTFRILIAQSLGTTDDFDQVVRSRLEDLAKLRSEA